MARTNDPLLRWIGLGLIAVGVILFFVALQQGRPWLSSLSAGSPLPTPSQQTSPTPEPIVPTRTSTPLVVLNSPAPEPQPSPTPQRKSADEVTVLPVSPTAAPPSSEPPTAIEPASARSSVPPTSALGPETSGFSLTFRGRFRWGVGVALGPISRYPVEELHLGWYLDWQARADPPRPGGIEYVPVVRLRGGRLQPDATVLAEIARAQPGSLWLIGNEPDVKWQDNVEPQLYARLYHEAYTAIKGADPTAQVAIGGVSQPTPLRLRYLDAVLTAYREEFGTEMPVDVWNVHNFILREERDSWGVDIPPGLPDKQGMLYEVDDSGSLEHFQRQLWDFRRWMAERGFQNTPLVVSEYGIPMPADYGFPPERVLEFLYGTFEFFLTAADPSVGYPDDGYRLVQRWCWYSLDDVVYTNGRLFDPHTGAMTAIGEGWKALVMSLRTRKGKTK